MLFDMRVTVKIMQVMILFEMSVKTFNFVDVKEFLGNEFSSNRNVGK